MNIIYDGDFEVKSQTGPDVFWFDNVTQSELFTREYEQIASSWEARARAVAPEDSPLASFYFCEESQPSSIGGELVKFTQTFAKVPGARNEPEPYTYHGQQVEDVYIIDYAMQTTARAAYEYFFSTEDGLDVPLIQPYTVSIVNGVIYTSGSAGIGSEVVAEASTVSRWRGNIFERRTLYVTPRTYVTA